MKNTNLKTLAVPLSEVIDNILPEEREVIDAEKKYYQIVVALKKEREVLGLTQEKLSQLSKIPRTTITKVEAGSRNVTLETIMLLAQAMGKKVELRLL